MRCPSCGASVNSAFCEYCGAKMPVERVETQSIHADSVVVNNYYYPNPQRLTRSMGTENAGQPVGLDAAFTPAVSPKSRLIALLLCFFLGVFGAHRFYAGRYLMGAVYLLTLGALGVGWLVDLVLILLGRMRDRNRLAIANW